MRNTIKNNIWKYLEIGLLAICIITYVVGIFWQKQCYEIIVGAIGFIYCIRYFIVFCKPIKRDWLLTRGYFLDKVIKFVLFIPVTITAIVHLVNIGIDISNKHFAKNYEDYNHLSSKELVYEDNLYKEEYSGIDTLGVITCNEEGKSCTILKQSNLPDSIKEKQENPSLLWTVYYHFIDPGNQHMTTTHRGRIISGIIATLGFLLLNGLLISMLISWIDRRREQWLKGEVRYKRFLRRAKKKFYIVIGGNDVAIGIVSELFVNNKGKELPYIVIQTLRDVESFRRELFSELTEEQQKHIIIYYGNRTSKDDIAYLYIENAIEVFVIGEDTRTDDIESYHDTINMRCFDLILEHFKGTEKGKKITPLLEKVNKLKTHLSNPDEKGKIELITEKNELEKEWKESLLNNRLKCHVMFEYQTTFSVFQFFDINETVNAYIDFKPFNYYEVWAQKTLINKEIFKKNIETAFENGGYLPLEGAAGIKERDDNYVHLFIVGMSRMGIAMAIEAAHLCHYPNYESKNIRTKITFIDKNAAEEKNFFIGRFKELFALSHWRYGNINESGVLEWKAQDNHFPTGFEYLGGDFLDIEWEFINGGIETAAVQNYILKSANPLAKVTIAICLPESNRSHAAALFLNKKIYSSDSVLQVLVYNRYSNAIINSICRNNSTPPYHGKLRCFGYMSEHLIVSYIKTSEYLGHEIIKAYNNGQEADVIKKNNSYEGKSDVANLWSSIYSGNTMWTKLRSIAKLSAIDENDIQLLADVEHNRWNIEELLMNFRYLTQAEQESVLLGKSTKNQMKYQMAHLDICSNKKLREIDKTAQKYDKLLTAVLGEIYKNMQANT